MSESNEVNQENSNNNTNSSNDVDQSSNTSNNQSNAPVHDDDNNVAGDTTNTNQMNPTVPEGTGTPSAPAEEPFTFHPGTNVIVAINYVLQGTGTAAANLRTTGDGQQGSNSNSTNDTSGENGTANDSTTGDTTDNNTNNNNNNNNNETVGSFYLNFTGLPANTSPERFSQLMSIAANVALSRLSRGLNRPRKLKKEFFDRLPVKKFIEVDGEVCSICYDPYVKDDKEIAAEKEEAEAAASSTGLANNLKDKDRDTIKKRKLKDGEVEEEHRSNSNKSRKLNDEQGVSTTSQTATLEAGQEGRSEMQTAESTTNTEVLNAVDEASNNNNNNSSIETPGATEETANAPSEQQETEKNDDDDEYKHSAVELPCHHIFGRSCIYEWCKEHNSCPVCRAQIGSDDDLEPLQLMNHIQNLGEDPTFDLIRRLLYGTPTEGNDNETNGNANGDTNGNAASNASNESNGQDATDTANATTDGNSNNERQNATGIPGFERFTTIGGGANRPSIIYLRRARDETTPTNDRNDGLPNFIREMFGSDTVGNANQQGNPNTNATDGANINAADNNGNANGSETGTRPSTPTGSGAARGGGISTLLRDLFTRSNSRDTVNTPPPAPQAPPIPPFLATGTGAGARTAAGTAAVPATSTPIPTEAEVEERRENFRRSALNILDTIFGHNSSEDTSRVPEPIVGQQGVASYRDSSGRVSTVNIPRTTAAASTQPPSSPAPNFTEPANDADAGSATAATSNSTSETNATHGNQQSNQDNSSNSSGESEYTSLPGSPAL
ncbi:hypothetical protein ACO0QE_002734 [Hanseniaspora vineae]